MSPGPGLPSDAIEKGRNFKIITEVQQDGQNFTWSQHYPGGHSMTNKFTIGKECDMETMGGKKFKVSSCWTCYLFNIPSWIDTYQWIT